MCCSAFTLVAVCCSVLQHVAHTSMVRGGEGSHLVAINRIVEEESLHFCLDL